MFTNIFNEIEVLRYIYWYKKKNIKTGWQYNNGAAIDIANNSHLHQG